MRTITAILILIFYSTTAVTGQPAGRLEHLEGKDLDIAVWALYTGTIQGADSARAFEALGRIAALADRKADARLKALSLFLKGKYAYDKRLWKSGLPIRYLQEAGKELPDIPYLRAEVLFYTGFWHYFSQHNYPTAFENLLKADRIASRIGYRSFPNAGELLHHFSNAYYQFGEIPKTIHYLKIGITLPPVRPSHRIDMLNTLGLCYRDTRQTDSARYFFHRALEEATRLQDSAWIGIVTGNLGHIYYISGDRSAALRFLHTDFAMSSRNGQRTSAASAALLLSQIYFDSRRQDSAILMLETARKLAYQVSNPQTYLQLYRTMAGYYRSQGNAALALRYTDSMIWFKDRLAKEKDLADLERGRSRAETEAHLAHIRLLESEKDKEILIRNGAIGLAFLLLVIGWQTARKMRLRQKKDRRIFELERQKTEQELDSSRQQLAAYMESLRQKNQLLEKFEEEVEALQHKAGSPLNIEKEEILQRLQEATILTEEDWQGFKKLFTRVHPSFFMQLHEKFPSLTQAETRILALSKLGLSVKEKANMLGISPDSVRRTQQRLNKKLGLTEAEIFNELVS